MALEEEAVAEAAAAEAAATASAAVTDADAMAENASLEACRMRRATSSAAGPTTAVRGSGAGAGTESEAGGSDVVMANEAADLGRVKLARTRPDGTVVARSSKRARPMAPPGPSAPEEVYALGSCYRIDFAAPVAGSSKVFRAWSVAAGPPLVAKVWVKASMCAAEKASLASELDILRLIAEYGPESGCIELHDYAEDDNYAALLFPYVEGGDLLEYVHAHEGEMDEAMARPIFGQIVDAVAMLHTQLCVAHLDLKLENVLLSWPDGGPGAPCATLIDFGFSKHCDSPSARLEIHCGSPSYISPEMLRKPALSPFASDVWSLGVVLYTLLTANFLSVAKPAPSPTNRFSAPSSAAASPSPAS
ncbi:CAMK/CAMKL protein kinase [Thecamonas trahens ATCC 50062]|uniref:CAMK/CAMKL protein kinase n=1 Tax=Thecamonas trahens ATCC 50062 TaxID=461836 RepID=A0A0L0DWW8_THETB|nr:CAMK/CAMKL protein kinase [Thecamonas trahens ATCC 50062]KNC56038.1 CAMK/CAMKL protein kinase [Thecamonas trahens ATCC 50062]|eukprot:XP_013761082.1 CAMK/CAMKL protein kinase [Thecamonas trahens ATCC 50062]